MLNIGLQHYSKLDLNWEILVTENSGTTGPKPQILFYKKSPPQDFIRRTLNEIRTKFF